MPYRLTQNAKEDLRRIYARGLDEFGEQQADAYFFALFERFETIASDPLRYQAVDEIRKSYRRSLIGIDSIYFRIDDDVVEITAVLGRQDHEKWL